MASSHPDALPADRPVEVNHHDPDALIKEIAALKSHLASLSQLLLERGKGETADVARQFGPAAKQALASTQTSIRARPVLSLLLAFLIGLLFGRLFARK